MTRLGQFLYLLQRDHVPTGVVEKLVAFVEEFPSVEPTSVHLAHLAEDQATRLHEEDPTL